MTGTVKRRKIHDVQPIEKKSPSKRFRGSENPNLYLVGFMGTGKSVLGRNLARLLGMRFIDSDQWIERKEGRPITRIFAEDGEGYFRKLEADFVENGHPEKGCVIACGGGMIVPDGIYEKLEKKGVVLALYASPETILRRTSRSSKRPLLNVENPEEKVLSLLKEREPVYRKVKLGVMTDQRSVPDLRQRVLSIYLSKANDLRKVSPSGNSEPPPERP